jgi:hypothetical protein
MSEHKDKNNCEVENIIHSLLLALSENDSITFLGSCIVHLQVTTIAQQTNIKTELTVT